MADKKGSGEGARADAGNDKAAKPTSEAVIPEGTSPESTLPEGKSAEPASAGPGSDAPKATGSKADAAKPASVKSAAEQATDAKATDVKPADAKAPKTVSDGPFSSGKPVSSPKAPAAKPLNAPDAKPQADQGLASVDTSSTTTTSGAAAPTKTGAPAKADESAVSDGPTSVPKTSTVKPSSSSSQPASSAAKAVSPAPTQAPTPTPIQRRGGFFPLLLGGVCAAAIGFGAAYYILPEMGLMTPTANASADMSAKLDEQSRRITALQAQLDATPAPVVSDLSGIEAGQQQLEERLDALSQQIGSFDTRINALESQPVAGGGGVSPNQLSALRDIVAAQTERIDALSEEAQQRENAERASAQQDLRRAALTRIRTALDTGSGFAAALGDLERAGMSAPDALQSVAVGGVATRADLQDSFAPAARAALTIARKTKSDGEAEGSFWTFMSEQLGARSLEPQEGTGADAVLSRAEDDVRQDKLDSALREIASLSEPVQAELAYWTTRARARMEALAAYDALAAKLN